MNAVKTWTDLHDATLESVELAWSSGKVVIRVRTGDVMHARWVVVATSLRRLGCDRQTPWGFSASINEVRGPTALSDDAAVLEIEMQSGDLIRIEAGAFTLQVVE
jgi:hypothetical protein